MNRSSGPTELQKAKEVLNRALPDDTEDLKVVNLPNRAMHIEITLREHAEEGSKWADFAEEMHRESSLHGDSEAFNARVHHFRDNFSFDREE